MGKTSLEKPKSKIGERKPEVPKQAKKKPEPPKLLEKMEKMELDDLKDMIDHLDYDIQQLEYPHPSSKGKEREVMEDVTKDIIELKET